MEIALRIEEFVHECVLMHKVLRDGRPITDMEFRLLERQLRMLVAEVAQKKFRQISAPQQTVVTSH